MSSGGGGGKQHPSSEERKEAKKRQRKRWDREENQGGEERPMVSERGTDRGTRDKNRQRRQEEREAVKSILWAGADQLTATHRGGGGAMMGKDYMLAIIIVNYDGETPPTHTHTQCDRFSWVMMSNGSDV